MKAIITKRYGDASVLQYGTMEQPRINDNEILVKIAAFSVNPVDWKIRSGQIKIKTGLKPPTVLGSDFAGTIECLGKNVNAYQINDRVWGKVDSFKGGAYAEYIKVKAENISPIPSTLTDQQAAAIPNAALTAYQALVGLASIKAEDKVLINGASGGVGIMATQIAKAYGCHVSAVCSTANVSLVKELGADTVIDYSKDDLLANKGCYDVFFDCVAKRSIFQVQSSMKSGGVYVSTLPSIGHLLSPITSMIMKKTSKLIMVKPNHDQLKELKRLVETKQLIPVVAQTFDAKDIAQAHTISATGRVVGKLVINF